MAVDQIQESTGAKIVGKRQVFPHNDGGVATPAPEKKPVEQPETGWSDRAPRQRYLHHRSVQVDAEMSSTIRIEEMESDQEKTCESPGKASYKHSFTMQDLFSEVQEIVERNDIINDYKNCVLEQVALMKSTSLSQLCGPNVLKRLEAQWSKAVLDASATVQVKTAQLGEVIQYHKLLGKIKALLEEVDGQKKTINLHPLESSAQQAEQLQALLQRLNRSEEMWEELLALSSQLAVHLSDAESSGVLLAQLGDVQDAWRLLSGHIKRALWQAANSTCQSSVLMKEVRRLKDKIAGVQESINSYGECHDTKSILELFCLSEDLKMCYQIYGHLQSFSDALFQCSIGQKEKKSIELHLEELRTLLQTAQIRPSVCGDNPHKQFKEWITWAKQMEYRITMGQKLSLFPEEARIQIVEMKKYQTDSLSRRSKMKLEEMREDMSDMNNEDYRQGLKVVEDLYQTMTENLDNVIDRMKKNLQERETLLDHIDSIDVWLVETKANKDPSAYVENVSRVDISSLENKLKRHQEVADEIERHLALVESLETKFKEVSESLSPVESCYIVNRLSGIWTEFDGLLAQESATSWHLAEMIHERTSSGEELATIKDSLKNIYISLDQLHFPMTQEAILTIAHLEQMLMEHQCQVQEIQHSDEVERSSLLCTIGELQERCKVLSFFAFEQDKYLQLKKQMEYSMDTSEEQIQHARDRTLSLGERFKLFQALLVDLPLMKTQCQEAADQLEVIAQELNPTELDLERQNIRYTVDKFVTWEHTASDEIKHLEGKLLLGLRFSSELPTLMAFFQTTTQELQSTEPVSPDERAIDVALQRRWVIWKNMESGMRMLRALASKGKINLQSHSDLHSFREAAMHECHIQMECLSKTRESLKDYQWAAQGAIHFLHNAEMTFLSAPGGFLDCTEEQTQTQQAIEALEEGFVAHIQHLVQLVPQQACVSCSKTQDLHIGILSQLLVGRAILEAQAQLRLESLQRCALRQQSHRVCHSDVQLRLTEFEAKLSACAAEEVTSYNKCTAQHKQSKDLMEGVYDLARKTEELRARCPMQGCGVGKDGELGALWRRWVSLRRGVGLLMAQTDQRVEEWKDITTSVEQCRNSLAILQTKVPDSLTVILTQDELQRLVSQAEMQQVGLEQEQQTLASLEHCLEHALGWTTSKDPSSLPGPFGVTLVKIQENIKCLKERNLHVIAVAHMEERQRHQFEERIGEVEKSMITILPMLDNDMNSSQHQELTKDLTNQRVELKSILVSLQEKYTDIPPDFGKRIQKLEESVEEAEKKLIKQSEMIRKLACQVTELISGLEQVKISLGQKSTTLLEAQSALKHVWDRLDSCHSRLMLLENDVQDLVEEKSDQAHLFMDQLTRPMQLYQEAVQMAEHRTAFLNKIPAFLQEFEDLLSSANCWFDEAQAWLNTPCSFPTSKGLHSHARSLQLVLDDSTRIRSMLKDFRPVLAEISTVCDLSAQEMKMEITDQQVEKMQKCICELMEQLKQAVEVVDTMENELQAFEENIPKIRTILSSMNNSSITTLEHLQNQKVILDNVHSMQNTLADMEHYKEDLSLPQETKESLLVFSRIKVLLQVLNDLEHLTRQQTILLEEAFEESNSEDGLDEDESCHSSSSDTLTCSIPEDPEDTLDASEVQSKMTDMEGQSDDKEWTRWEDNSSRFGRLLDNLEVCVSRSEAEGEDEEESHIQQRLHTCQQTLVEMEVSRAALGLLVDQTCGLQTDPTFATSVKQAGGALELRWRRLRSRVEEKVQHWSDIWERWVRFQTDFASVSKWLLDANKHLTIWSELSTDASHVNQENVCKGFIKVLKLLLMWPPMQLLAYLEDWLTKQEVQLEKEREKVHKATDAAHIIKTLQCYQALKMSLVNGQPLLEFLSQTPRKVMGVDVQTLRAERIMYAEQLGALRQRWIHLQGSLESQIHGDQELYYTCSAREKQLKHLRHSVEQQKKQINQWKYPSSQTQIQKVLQEWEAVVGRIKDVAAALQGVKTTRVFVEKEHPCDVAFCEQAETVSLACEDLIQQMQTLDPVLQQVVKEWSCLDRNLREVSQYTSRVLCTMKLYRETLFSLKLTEDYLELLQQLQEMCEQAKKLWTDISKSFQILLKTLNAEASQSLNDRIEQERKRWEDMMEKLKEEHQKTDETLILWQKYNHAFDNSSHQLEHLWCQFSSFSPQQEPQTTVQLMEKLQNLAEDLQNSVENVLALSKPLIGCLKPLAQNVVQSESMELSLEILLLNQAMSDTKKSFQENLENDTLFHTQLEALEQQIQNIVHGEKSNMNDKDIVKQELLKLIKLLPSVVDVSEMSGCVILNKEEKDTLHKLSKKWTHSVNHMSFLYRTLQRELQQSQDFHLKCQKLTFILEMLESELPESFNIQEKLAVQQSFECSGVWTKCSFCFCHRSELLTQVVQLRKRWFRALSLAGQHQSKTGEQIHQWRIYKQGMKVLGKTLKTAETLLSSAQPSLTLSPVTSQRLAGCYQNWSQCQDGMSTIMCELDKLRTQLKWQLPEKMEESEQEERLQKTDLSLRLVAGGLKDLASMKTDLSPYVAAADSALLEQQLEQLHIQWEELCTKVSLRRQEIADHLNAWTIFNDKNKEFCDWLTQIENKVCQSTDLSIEEMVEKLKKDCMEEINLFSENKSHLKQLGEQLLLASDEAKQTQVFCSLQEINQRWHNLFGHIETRVTKLKETLLRVQQLDKNMSNLRSWLSRVEAELSRPITYSVCHHQEIQKRLAEQQELQRDIEQHTDGVTSVLNLCDLLLRDEDAAAATEMENDSLQETSRSLDQRWRTIRVMALDRRLRIEETWKLWCKFLEDYSQFEDWLKMAEKTASNPNTGDVLYTVAKEELKKFEGFQRQVHERLTQLELVNNQYRRLARENRTDRSSQLKAMVHEGNRRWDILHRRVAAILRRLKHFTSQREEFEGTRESMLVWLTELDLQLTNVEHFSESDVHHKIQQLSSFQKEIIVNTERIDGLIVFGESLIQRSSPEDAALIEEELEELHCYCQEVFSRLVRFHQRLSQPPIIAKEPEFSGTTFSLESSLELIGRPWLGRSQGSLPATPSHLLAFPLEHSGRETPVSVDSLPLEWDHTGDVGGSSSHEDDEDDGRHDEEGIYFSALSGRSMAAYDSPTWQPAGEEQTDAGSDTRTNPTLTSTPVKQSYLHQMSQCSDGVEEIKRVSFMLNDEEQPEISFSNCEGSDLQSGVIERWELLQAQSRNEQDADPRNPQTVTSDIDDVISWLDNIHPVLDRLQQSQSTHRIVDMATRAKEMKEMQKMFTRYKPIMLSANLRALEVPEEQEKLIDLNRAWSRASTQLHQWETGLRRTLMRCEEFHESLHSLLLWLAHAENRRLAVDIRDPETPVQILKQHHNSLTVLREELLERQTQQASLQTLWSQLQPDDWDEGSDEAQEKIHVTGTKLKLLLSDVTQDLSTLQQCLDFRGQDIPTDSFQKVTQTVTSLTKRESGHSAPSRPFFHRVLRAAFPFHLLFLFLLLLTCLVPHSDRDSNCTVVNNFARSFHPMLHYTNGPPPT
nr:nesprin-2-like [Nerophis lumbriciformis]